MDSLARGELDRGLDKTEFCFVKFAGFPLRKRANPRSALSNPCADLTTRTPRAKDPTEPNLARPPDVFDMYRFSSAQLFSGVLDVPRAVM